jgi:hypothetical protein
MKQFVAVASLLGLAAAEPFYGYGGYASHLTHGYAPALRTAYAAPIVSAPVAVAAPVVAAAPAVAQTVATVKAVPANVHAQQYHAQDEFGNYEYGYDNPNSQKKEAGNALTGVQGHYVVKNAFGGVRRYDYVADGAGFRAHRTIKREADAEAYYGNIYGAGAYGGAYSGAFGGAIHGYAHGAAHGYGYAPATLAAVSPAVSAVVSAPVVTNYAAPAAVAAPVVAAAPAVATVKAVPANVHAQQFHAQDEFGNFEYGYDNPNSQKKEAGLAGAAVRGHYTVKDGFGLDRRVDYVADAAGFRATKNFY